MSDILEKLNILFEQNIKLFHVFSDLNGKNVFIVTKDDKVFAFGSNNSGLCGFGHDNRVATPQEIPELSGKQIKQFFIGNSNVFKFVLALNENNKVFGWGQNVIGQLGRGFTNERREYLKPEMISDLENIIDISCDSGHSLALDRDGNVFSWGNNNTGQVGCGDKSVICIDRPVHLKSLPKIKSIHCSDSSSFAVTFDGLVHSWGRNSNYCLGHKSSDHEIFDPKIINGLNHIISVGCSRDNTYLFTNEGNIYFCGKNVSHEYQETPKILESDLKFQFLKTIGFTSKTTKKVLVSSEETIYYLERNSIQKTKYKSFIDYCLHEIEITSETLPNPIEIEYILMGSGNFGTVYKWMDKNNQNYALKIIPIQEKNSEYLKEVDTLSKCEEKYVVKYYRSWIDKDQFYIQMELCDNNLKNIIQQKRKCFERQTMSAMSLTEYFISSEIMKEILECVQYLHQMNPPIIHRDLKPQNVLVNYQSKNGRFIKLCDFGIAAFESDQTLSHTRGVGTTRYMAPEVIGFEEKNEFRVKYNTKADIYSLGIIFSDLIDFNINSSKLENKLGNLIEQMTTMEYNLRPDCKYLLNELSSINTSIYLETKQQTDIIQLNQNENKFFSNYFKQKCNEIEDKLGQINSRTELTTIDESPGSDKNFSSSDSDIDFSEVSFDYEMTENEETDDTENSEDTELELMKQSFFEILGKIFPNFNLQKYKYFDENVLFVTKDDKMFAFGSNHHGQCGLGHNRIVDTPQEIPELNGKQIKQFFIGNSILALNEDNQVYGWGENNGELCRGNRAFDAYLKPEIIPFLENIIDISCDSGHSLALDRDGNVFSWGNNVWGQVGCGEESGLCIDRPVQLRELPKIKSIHCYGKRSLAVTLDGFVYSWGENENYCLGHNSPDDIFEPKLINGLNNVISVGCSKDNTYFLTNEGNIYFCGKKDSVEYSDKDNLRGSEYQENPKILETNLKFQSLQTIRNHSKDSNNSKVFVSSEETIYYLERNSIQKTNYKTISDYCLNEKINILEKLKFKLLDSFGRYENLNELGSGSFGTVIKAKDKLTDNIYALKITNEYNKEMEKEAKLLSKCNDMFVVKYYDYWVEENQLYLKMELCSDNLDNILEEKKECFERQSTDVMTKIEFFISTHLMKEIVECVQYLHELDPPIIHRDLKPENVLVNYQQKNGRFLKLADFGLSTLGSDITISRTKGIGTPKYAAPEIDDGEIGKSGIKVKYSIKADIYSLGVIVCDLFGLNINSLDMKNNDLTQNWNELVKLIKNMLEYNYRNRPSCKDILLSQHLWTIEKIEGKDYNSEENQKNIKQMEEFDNKFFINYFNEKQKSESILYSAKKDKKKSLKRSTNEFSENSNSVLESNKGENKKQNTE